MNKTTRKSGPRITSDDKLDFKTAKASYAAMPGWERIAIWAALALLLLGILGDLIW